jgi:hypothetical protein
MQDDLAMAEEWIVLVEGREYGPVDLETLDEWKKEGRVLSNNQARPAQSDTWVTAAEIPGLFEPPVQARPAPAAHSSPPRGLAGILGDTFRFYGRGFIQFLCLSLLVIVPFACTQLTSAVLDTSAEVDVDVRSLLAGGFGFCMMILTFAAWPIYLAGIQILTAELKAGRRVGFFTVLNEATKFWPRTAALCLLVYTGFFLLIVFALFILSLIMVAGSSVFAVQVALILFALVLLVLQVWMFGRFFINVLFWQQFAVLGNQDVLGSLRESKGLARGRRDLVWYQRPLWRGAFLASLWLAFVIVLNLPLIWPTMGVYWNAWNSSQDPQKVMQALMASSKAQGMNLAGLGVGLLQAILRPLVGIAFVLLYLDATKKEERAEPRAD